MNTPTAPPGESFSRPKARNNATQRRRRWLPYAAGLLLLALIVAGLWPKPALVETARVSIGPLRSTINEEGKTRVKQRYVVSAPVTGQLRRIELKPGAEVEAGKTVVAVIEPIAPALLDARSRLQAEAKRDAAKANLEKARAAHTFAANELKRFEQLHQEKAISIQELEPVQWREASTARDESAAESTLRQAEAELALFQPARGESDQVCRTPTEVKSPAGGRVLRVFEESSRVTAAGTPLLEIGDPANLEAVIEVLSKDGAGLVAGTKAELEQWGGGAPLEGRVRLVEPSAFTKVSALGVEEQRVNVIVDMLTPPEQRLRLGDNFRVEARIVVWEADRALKVPSGALFRRGERWEAFVLAEGRAHLRRVKIGKTSGIETQVLEGLKENDEVIVYPGDRIRDNERAKAIKIEQ